MRGDLIEKHLMLSRLNRVNVQSMFVLMGASSKRGYDQNKVVPF